MHVHTKDKTKFTIYSYKENQVTYVGKYQNLEYLFPVMILVIVYAMTPSAP